MPSPRIYQSPVTFSPQGFEQEKLVRTGQTEGSVDLARLAGLEPADVICEVEP